MDKAKDNFLLQIPFFGCCLGQISIRRAVKNLKSSGFKLVNTGKPAISKILPVVVLNPLSFQKHTAAGLTYLGGICKRGFEELYWGTELVW